MSLILILSQKNNGFLFLQSNIQLVIFWYFSGVVLVLVVAVVCQLQCLLYFQLGSNTSGSLVESGPGRFRLCEICQFVTYNVFVCVCLLRQTLQRPVPVYITLTHFNIKRLNEFNVFTLSLFSLFICLLFFLLLAAVLVVHIQKENSFNSQIVEKCLCRKKNTFTFFFVPLVTGKSGGRSFVFLLNEIQDFCFSCCCFIDFDPI